MMDTIKISLYGRPSRNNPDGLIAEKSVYQQDPARVKEWRISPLNLLGVRVHRIVIKLPEGLGLLQDATVSD